MVAAATAAKTGQGFASGDGRYVALLLIIGGGLIEGVALGTAQAVGLRRVLPALSVRKWIVVTTLVAGLGARVGSDGAVR